MKSSQASMARVMCDNTDIEKAQPSMFLLPERNNLMVTCDSQRISRVNLEVSKDESGLYLYMKIIKKIKFLW